MSAFHVVAVPLTFGLAVAEPLELPLNDAPYPPLEDPPDAATADFVSTLIAAPASSRMSSSYHRSTFRYGSSAFASKLYSISLPIEFWLKAIVKLSFSK